MPVIRKTALNPVTKAGLQSLRQYFRRAGNIADAVFMQTVRELDKEYTKIFETPGYFADFPASDIIDTGALLKSQSFTLLGLGKVEFTWEAVNASGVAYASFVHDGYTLRDGNKQKGRHWTVDVQKDFDFVVKYEENLQRYIPGV